MPEMNDAYTEEGGKPAVARPEHVNLGLAIDLQAADGSRQLAGTEHQGRGGDGLPPVLDDV